MIRLLIAAFVLAVFPAVAQACPDVALGGQVLNYTAQELYAPKAFKVVAGGSENLDRCSLRGANSATGYVARPPDFELYYEGASNYELELRVVGSCDTVLLINTGNGNWYFDDDDYGDGDAKIRLSRPSSGLYDIWVGTYGPDTCNAQFQLETF